MATHVPFYKNIDVDVTGLGKFNINYVEEGSPDSPKIVLLHGFPTDSRQFYDLMPLLSAKYHVLAPDMPGFGLTTCPADLKYTFDNLAAAVGAWLAALDITSYAVYIFDYGAPVGLRLALQNPEQVKAIVTQNGNAYEAGFGKDFWAPLFRLWEHDSFETREWVRERALVLSGPRSQYTVGVPEADLRLIKPTQWHTDYLLNLAGKGNQERQLDLFYNYRTNVKLYPRFQEYFRKSQVPLLAVWGKGDVSFIPPGAEAFRDDLPDAEVHFVDSGHFALETKRWEIAELMLNFFNKIGY